MTKLLISSSQHGFVPTKSTITNLAVFFQYVSEVIDGNGQCEVIYTDFEKAVDKILKILISYLTRRISFVKYRNFSPKPFTPFSGVSQRPNLGHLLFLLFINDFPNAIPCNKLMIDDCYYLQISANLLNIVE